MEEKNKNKIDKLIDDYLHDELSDNEVEEFEEHLIFERDPYNKTEFQKILEETIPINKKKSADQIGKETNINIKKDFRLTMNTKIRIILSVLFIFMVVVTLWFIEKNENVTIVSEENQKELTLSEEKETDNAGAAEDAIIAGLIEQSGNDAIIPDGFDELLADRDNLQSKLDIKVYDNSNGTLTEQSFSVELWNIPANYSGYLLKTDQIQLFGMGNIAGASLLDHEGHLYLKFRESYYPLSQHEDIHPLEAITDQDLISKFSQ